MIAQDECVVFLTSSGKLYSMGSSEKGLLGHGPNVLTTRNVARQLILDPEREQEEVVVEIQKGREHFLARTSLGRVYGWGVNIHGQVGVLNTPENLAVGQEMS